MAWRIGSPSFRRLLIGLSVIAMVVIATKASMLGAPDLVVHALYAGIIVVPMYLFRLFGVRANV
jgi:hypothetical protein